MRLSLISVSAVLRGQIFKSVPVSEMEKLFRTHSLPTYVWGLKK